MDPLLELIDKINATGLSVLVIHTLPAGGGDAPDGPAALSAYVVRSWSPPAAHSAALHIYGQLLEAGQMAAVLDRARAGTLAGQAELEQALSGLRSYRRQYSPDHRWTLYDAHPAR